MMFEAVTPADFTWTDPTTYNTGSTRAEVLEQLLERGHHIYATGSRVTANYKENSDYDYVVLDTETYSTRDHLMNDYWYEGSSGNQYSEFYSLKKHVSGQEVNLIFVNTKETFTKYVMATNLIRKVNPSTKKERVELFDIIFKQSIPF